MKWFYLHYARIVRLANDTALRMGKIAIRRSNALADARAQEYGRRAARDVNLLLCKTWPIESQAGHTNIAELPHQARKHQTAGGGRESVDLATRSLRASRHSVRRGERHAQTTLNGGRGQHALAAG